VTEPSVAELKQVLAGLRALDYRRTYQQFYDFAPYPKQRDFLYLGAAKRERLLIAGNQNGKTHTGAFEAACHLTGLYPKAGEVFYADTPEMRAAGLAGKDAFPKGWQGRRWDRPTKGWIAGETSLVVRDVQQKKLCGEPGVETAFGTGMIPKDLFVDKPSLARGITDAYDTIQVRHASGGVSVARFKSYEQGRTKFQGESIDWGWADEEPPEDVYAEFLTRTVATGGMCFVTFTPLKGRSSVVSRFLDEVSPDRGVVSMTIDDALHIPISERERIIAGYLPHEREARARGVPTLGSGRIFQVSEETISEAAIERVPPHWVKLWGLDFGIDHPFAAALLLWDRDNDVIHLHHTIRMKDGGPLQHAVPLKAVAAGVPIAWPHDGNVRGDRNTGETMAQLYKKHGLWMLEQHATWPDGGYSTEAGIMELQERMTTGRFKAANHLADFFEEFRLYHRKDGQIVKERDDILSAVRIGVMMKRYAKAVPLGNQPRVRQSGGVAADVDFDLF
jgi:phage terminase large subunit-like protein